jgi:hypothetical protein
MRSKTIYHKRASPAVKDPQATIDYYMNLLGLPRWVFGGKDGAEQVNE